MPILCLASSKYWPPPPSPPGECETPAFGAGGGHTRWVERGWGVNILEDARHSSVLYICKYFVVAIDAAPPPPLELLASIWYFSMHGLQISRALLPWPRTVIFQIIAVRTGRLLNCCWNCRCRYMSSIAWSIVYREYVYLSSWYWYRLGWLSVYSYSWQITLTN